MNQDENGTSVPGGQQVPPTGGDVNPTPAPTGDQPMPTPNPMPMPDQNGGEGGGAEEQTPGAGLPPTQPGDQGNTGTGGAAA